MAIAFQYRILAVLALSTANLCSAFSPLGGSVPKVAPQKDLKMATWSDSRAVKEYQDFLASGKQEIEKTPDGPCVIVAPLDGGDMELADAIVQMGMGDDVILRKGQEAPAEIAGATAYPIYITIPPQELKEFLQNLPASFNERRDDFIFCSGGLKYGNIEKVLKDTGYCRDAMTQFLVSGFKTKPIIEDTCTKLGMSANGEDKYAGECAACGKWSGSVEARLENNAIRCKTVFYREWRRLMFERNVYDAVFNLVGAIRNEPTNMADVALYYGDEVSDMVWQISGILRGMKALTLTYGFEERIFGIAEATGTEQPCVVIPEMFPYIYEEYTMAAMLNEYLAFAQDEKGLLEGVSFLKRKADANPLIRQGNLRADGVI